MGVLLLSVNGLLVYLAITIVPELVESVISQKLSGYVSTKRLIEVGVMFACLTLDCAVLGWESSALRKLFQFSNSAMHDFTMWLIAVSGLGALGAAVFSFGQTVLAPKVAQAMAGPIQIESLQGHWMGFVASFLVIDFVYYWYHRALHRLRFAWEFHKYHHAATEFTLLTGARVHLLENAVFVVAVSFPVAIIGIPPETFLAVAIAFAAIDMMQHSMVDWDYGVVGRWAFFSPTGHRIHHSMLQEHRDHNFGNFLTIWDHMFGTWYAGDAVCNEIGIDDNHFKNENPISAHLDCILRSFWVLRPRNSAVRPKFNEGAADIGH